MTKVNNQPGLERGFCSGCYSAYTEGKTERPPLGAAFLEDGATDYFCFDPNIAKSFTLISVT